MKESKIEVKFIIDDNGMIERTIANTNASVRDRILAAMYLLEDAFTNQYADAKSQGDANPIADFVGNSFNAYLAMKALQALEDNENDDDQKD